MYIIDQAKKDDPHIRWNLPDRIFFACGACQVLAYVFITEYARQGCEAIWIKPAPDFRGNHIVAVSGTTAFDYHGFTNWQALLRHEHAKATRWWPGWNHTLVKLPQKVLISEAKSKTYDGLWLRQPDQFLHDPSPRARAFIERKIARVSRRVDALRA